jgi:hypothetical protein
LSGWWLTGWLAGEFSLLTTTTIDQSIDATCGDLN